MELRTRKLLDRSFSGLGISAIALMAIALFDLLPELHKHIMKILNPIFNAAGKLSGTNKSS